MKKSVLFVCVKNSARSQMAEAFVNAYCPDDFQAESAGLEPGELNPLAVQVMAEIGIDISAKETRRVFDVFKTGRVFTHAISLCDEASEGRCPIVLRSIHRDHWSFTNPTDEDANQTRLDKMRIVRDLISARVKQWCAEQCLVAS